MEALKKYDLEERTTLYGENIIEFALKVPKNQITSPLINQLVRSGTSIGANYLEANDTITSKDFIYRMGICRREARETGYWLKMITKAVPDIATYVASLQQEAKELNLIFSSIIRKRKDS